MLYLITNALIVNEGKSQRGSVLIADGKIAEIYYSENFDRPFEDCTVIDAYGKYLLPGVIDSHVHFRQPGLTHKGDMLSESRAALVGGITSFMDMPNTVPKAVSRQTIDEKYKIAAKNALCNYAFYIGATNDNLDELLETDFSKVCGVKLFLGSSTGDMLVNQTVMLDNIFSKVKALIAVHCEDEAIIRENEDIFRQKYGEDVPIAAHALIRSEEACFRSSAFAVEMAKKYDSRLHVLHLTTGKETGLFANDLPLEQKRITAEVCVNQLLFCDADYQKHGTLLKWNPSVKTAADRDELLVALLDNRIDTVATDHAPHTREEKQNTYFKAPSGSPSVQHALPAILEFVHKRKMTIEQVVEKMCHNPARLFRIKQRGFIKKGYWADIVLVDTNCSWKITKNSIMYKCGWSPLIGTQLHSDVTHTWVNGKLVYCDNVLYERPSATMPLEFENNF
jgi:dihydroorotase